MVVSLSNLVDSFLKEFIKLNVNMGMITKNMKFVKLNTQTLKMI